MIIWDLRGIILKKVINVLHLIDIRIWIYNEQKMYLQFDILNIKFVFVSAITFTKRHISINVFLIYLNVDIINSWFLFIAEAVLYNLNTLEFLIYIELKFIYILHYRKIKIFVVSYF